jgi:polyvinyl alcohol dehydrogenase (cytochrome)
VAPPPAAWTSFGFDASNSRFNPDERAITPRSVGGLTERWHRDDLPGVSGTPMVVAGTVYFGDWDGVVHAVDAATGEERWRAEVGSPVMSSVTVTHQGVYAATNDHVVLLDPFDGTERWRARTSDHPIAISPGSPVVTGELVVQTVASGELMIGGGRDYTFRGTVAAFDALTGEEAWRLELTADDAESGAGVGVWSTPAVDHERGLLFIGTGNTYEPPASRLADSLVAVEVATGEIAWSTQFTFPDVWSASGGDGLDADVGSGPNLWEVDGRPLVGAADKTGVYHALDRTTGEVVWEAELTPGSILGGVIGTSARGEGRLYVASNIGAGEGNAPTGRAEVSALDERDGTVLWEHEVDGAVYASVSAVPGVVFVASTSGTLHALDAAGGDELWSVTAPEQSGSAPSVVDGTLYWGWGFALFGSGSGNGGVYAFGLDGDEPTEDPGDGTAAGPGEDAEPGAEVYRTSCASCHGTDGRGGVGPSLTGVADRLEEAEHERIVREGVPGSQMIGFDDALTDEEIRDVVAYERSMR